MGTLSHLFDIDHSGLTLKHKVRECATRVPGNHPDFPSPCPISTCLRPVQPTTIDHAAGGSHRETSGANTGVDRARSVPERVCHTRVIQEYWGTEKPKQLRADVQDGIMVVMVDWLVRAATCKDSAPWANYGQTCGRPWPSVRYGRPPAPEVCVASHRRRRLKRDRRRLRLAKRCLGR
jgi:hypothetical protein